VRGRAESSRQARCDEKTFRRGLVPTLLNQREVAESFCHDVGPKLRLRRVKRPRRLSEARAPHRDRLIPADPAIAHQRRKDRACAHAAAQFLFPEVICLHFLTEPVRFEKLRTENLQNDARARSPWTIRETEDRFDGGLRLLRSPSVSIYPTLRE